MIINTAKAFLSQNARKASIVAARSVAHNQSIRGVLIRQFNFGSSQYASCFDEIPKPDVDKFKRDAMEYLDGFDAKFWYNDPIVSILNGQKLTPSPSNLHTTTDALSNPNGHQYYATPSQVSDLLAHIQNYHSPYLDIRPQIRRIEQKFLNDYAGFLIGNQCLDFAKQDGITEMEESVMANAVERKLNDALLQSEGEGKVVIERKCIYVSCVSNFTNFLDLFRKTLRSLELGIPCVILGRSHTIQHSYRWADLLVELMKEEGIDPGMLTYLSCQLEDIKYITASSAEQAGMLYTTCSRQLAKAIKENYENTIASTGGPNTLIATEWTPGVQDAIRMSASIECAGQCTALRHAVVPETVKLSDVEAMFDSINQVASPVEALRQSSFDGVFEKHRGTSPPAVGKSAEYTKHPSKDAYFKVSRELPSPESNEMDEYWRKVVVDVTNAMPTSISQAKDQMVDLSKWLIRHQPISIAVNAKRSQVFDLGLTLWENTALVVNTIGSIDKSDAPPAMTCQARPQDAECFGEFPPRKSLGVYTKYPVVVPSSTPSYDTHYRVDYLKSLLVDDLECSSFIKAWLNDIHDEVVKGYCIELIRCLTDATAQNPKRGFGTGRTALWGLQRPPLLDGLRTLVRCGSDVTMDELSPIFLLFYATNARSQVELSVDDSNKALLDCLLKHDLDNHIFNVVVEGNETMSHRVKADGENFYNVVSVPAASHDCERGICRKYPMPGQFVSLYLPLGHIKSTMKNDEEFVKYFSQSEKWLKMVH